MAPKGKLLALVAIVAAVGVVTATGAFSTVSAERTATVDVNGDSSALLQITDGDGSTAGTDYVQTAGNGETEISIPDVNVNATTSVNRAIEITNQGTQEIGVSLDKTGQNAGAVGFGVRNSELDSADPEPRQIQAGVNRGTVFSLSDATVALEPGESVQIGIYVDTADGNVLDVRTDGTAIGQDSELLQSVIIDADGATASDAALEAK